MRTPIATACLLLAPACLWGNLATADEKPGLVPTLRFSTFYVGETVDLNNSLFTCQNAEMTRDVLAQVAQQTQEKRAEYISELVAGKFCTRLTLRSGEGYYRIVARYGKIEWIGNLPYTAVTVELEANNAYMYTGVLEGMVLEKQDLLPYPP